MLLKISIKGNDPAYRETAGRQIGNRKEVNRSALIMPVSLKEVCHSVQRSAEETAVRRTKSKADSSLCSE
jgi:hypothetical protein